MDHSLPGSSVHGILQARILEWFDISLSRGSSQPSTTLILMNFSFHTYIVTIILDSTRLACSLDSLDSVVDSRPNGVSASAQTSFLVLSRCFPSYLYFSVLLWVLLLKRFGAVSLGKKAFSLSSSQMSLVGFDL